MKVLERLFSYLQPSSLTSNIQEFTQLFEPYTVFSEEDRKARERLDSVRQRLQWVETEIASIRKQI